MRVFIQIKRDDGSVLCEMEGNAEESLQWVLSPFRPVKSESGNAYVGFEYTPKIVENVAGAARRGFYEG